MSGAPQGPAKAAGNSVDQLASNLGLEPSPPTLNESCSQWAMVGTGVLWFGCCFS